MTGFNHCSCSPKQRWTIKTIKNAGVIIIHTSNLNQRATIKTIKHIVGNGEFEAVLSLPVY